MLKARGSGGVSEKHDAEGMGRVAAWGEEGRGGREGRRDGLTSSPSLYSHSKVSLPIRAIFLREQHARAAGDRRSEDQRENRENGY